MNPKRDFIGICITLWLAAATVQNASAEVRFHPFIVKQPPATDILFQVADRDKQEGDKPFMIDCEAKGNPPPIYLWLKNSKKFNWQDQADRIFQRPGRGTLIFASPRDEDAGEYGCIAKNELSYVFSRFVQVRKVETVEASEAKKNNVRLVEAKEGEPFKLTCDNHSEGRPKPEVEWNLLHKVGGYMNLDSSRLTVDPAGDLCLSNVTREDASTDLVYVCSAFYPSNEYKMETYALQVIPMKAYGHQPVAQYVTNPNILAQKGDDVEIWCVIAGTPLPVITWTKRNGTLSTDRVEHENYGRSLRFRNVQLSDAGTYVCDAANGVGTPITHLVKLEVHASRSKLEVAWSHQDSPLKKNVQGILAGTKTSTPIVIPFNSTETYTTFSSGKSYGLAFDWNSGSIYRLEDKIGIIRSNLNGSESEILFPDQSSWLYGIAVEPISGNLYYGNWTSGTIKVCNNDATKCSSIANSNEGFVYDFAFHPSKGLIFWSIKDKHVVKANLDGSNATIIMEWPCVRGLEVDELEDRLYWGSITGIASCDLNSGNDIRLLSSVEGFVQDVATDDENVYYFTPSTMDILVISKLGTISSSIKQLEKYPYWNMALFGTRVSNKPPNPCENSDCAHLCVLTSLSSHRCVCADDEELNGDGKSCTFTSVNKFPVVPMEFRNLMMIIMGGSQLVPTV